MASPFTTRVSPLRTGDVLRGASPFTVAATVSATFSSSGALLPPVLPASGVVAATFSATAAPTGSLPAAGEVLGTFSGTVAIGDLDLVATLSATFTATASGGTSVVFTGGALVASFSATGTPVETLGGTAGMLTATFSSQGAPTPPASPVILFVAQEREAGTVYCYPKTFQMLTTEVWPLGFDMTALLDNAALSNPQATLYDINTNKTVSLEDLANGQGNIITQIVRGSQLTAPHGYRLTVTCGAGDDQTVSTVLLLNVAVPSP